MENILRDDERKAIEKISSKIHGPEYLLSDLKNILDELYFLLKINNAIIFIDFKNIQKQEFHGKGRKYFEKYPKLIKEYNLKSVLKNKCVFVKNLNSYINNLFVIPIQGKDKIIGTLMIFNREINYGDKHDSKIIQILESQINFAVKKALERAELFKLFGKYLDQRQIFEIIKNPNFLKKPKLTDSVVLFADISGFTKLTNKSDTEFIFNFLGKIMNECSGIINKHNGIVDKFVGDRVIGIFGIVDSGNRSENALKSAVEIRDFFNKKLSKSGIGVKISIVKGDMIYGNLGGKYRADLTVIGKNVNFASRLCDYAKKNEILVGDKVYEKLRGEYKFKVKGFKKFKGFGEWSKIYKFIG